MDEFGPLRFIVVEGKQSTIGRSLGFGAEITAVHILPAPPNATRESPVEIVAVVRIPAKHAEWMAGRFQSCMFWCTIYRSWEQAGLAMNARVDDVLRRSQVQH